MHINRYYGIFYATTKGHPKIFEATKPDYDKKKMNKTNNND